MEAQPPSFVAAQRKLREKPMSNPYPDEEPNPALQKIIEGHEQIAEARTVDQNEITDALLSAQELADEIRTHEKVLAVHGYEINSMLVEAATHLENLCGKLYETLEAVRLLAGQDAVVQAQENSVDV